MTPNMKKTISSHNTKIETKSKELLSKKKFNSQFKKKFPPDGKFQKTNVAYQATVTEKKTQKASDHLEAKRG